MKYVKCLFNGPQDSKFKFPSFDFLKNWSIKSSDVKRRKNVNIKKFQII